jgi:hypothetical protein
VAEVAKTWAEVAEQAAYYTTTVILSKLEDHMLLQLAQAVVEQ